ncbi:MAG: hypothetical protein ACKO5Q_25035, partial [Microcystaceae cyanobacterium]
QVAPLSLVKRQLSFNQEVIRADPPKKSYNRIKLLEVIWIGLGSVNKQASISKIKIRFSHSILR